MLCGMFNPLFISCPLRFLCFHRAKTAWLFPTHNFTTRHFTTFHCKTKYKRKASNLIPISIYIPTCLSTQKRKKERHSCFKERERDACKYIQFFPSVTYVRPPPIYSKSSLPRRLFVSCPCVKSLRHEEVRCRSFRDFESVIRHQMCDKELHRLLRNRFETTNERTSLL